MIARIRLVLALVMIAPALMAQTPARAADLPRLKASVTVTRDTVRIGDLIENAGAQSDIAIFRAPDPGSTGSVPAERVLDAARQHNLLLVDTAGVDDVQVTRVSRAIGRADIERRIVRTFAQYFNSGDPARFAI
jgi:flagella basal body P-ring formation protein FlgA